MALTQYQKRICRLIAKQRTESGESYVAAGAALNELLRAPRLSRDVDLFHDTKTAVEASLFETPPPDAAALASDHQRGTRDRYAVAP